MQNYYLKKALGVGEQDDKKLTNKIEKMYNSDPGNKYNSDMVLQKIGISNAPSGQTNYKNAYHQNTYSGKQSAAIQPISSQKSFYDYFDGSGIEKVRNARKALAESIKEKHKSQYVPESAVTVNQAYEENGYAESGQPESAGYDESEKVTFNSGADENSLGSLDVTTELPKLTTNQIKDIISTYFSKSTVITPSDAEGIYNAQQNTGMSALAILGIGALESGYGTSNIAKKKGNIWGWGATNSDRMGNAKTFSQMSTGASEFANAYLNTYYNKYGAKSINSAGTGNNPAGKGYAYYDNGTIEKEWATKVSSIMKKFYQRAKNTASSGQSADQSASKSSGKVSENTTSDLSNKVGTKIADVSGYNNSAAKGQCVWFVRGRMKQKLGKDTGSLGNGNQMWYNAKSSAKLAPTEANIKPNTIASYKTGLSSAGKKYGHVIYIEDVVGDTVYYTEGGSYYYNNGSIGTLKKASKKEILNGSSKFGYGLIGFIDAANY